MECLLIGGGVGVFLGVTGGALAMALVVAAHEDDLPRPTACAYPYGACLAAQQPGTAF
jgi:hypothetical protein